MALESVFGRHFSKSRVLFKIVPALAGVMALAAYWTTVDPGASYWDCPEYLMSAIRLEVGHPPGNPGWMLFHRVVSSVFPDPALQVRVVNMMSGLFAALAVMLLCSISISAMRWIWRGKGEWRTIAISLSSLAGALCFAFSDSAWYSAVEAEVYSMSLFLSSLVVWMALKWAFVSGAAARTRWMIALFYVTGFSLGVHQLNLLVIPAIALIVLFRIRGRRKSGFIRTVIALALGCLIVVLILKGLMPGSVALAGQADLVAVNKFGLPYWSGALCFWIAALSIVLLIAVLSRRRMSVVSVSFWCLAAVMVGYSVYILIPVRAWANPPVNEGNPSDPFRLADYLDRRQYAKSPLFHGRTPYSKPMRLERISVSEMGDTLRDYSMNAMSNKGRDMRPVVRDGRIPDRSRFMTEKDRALNSLLTDDSLSRGYVVTGFRTELQYTPELDMWFPRIHSSSPGDLASYSDWTGMDSSNMVRVRISEAFDSSGRPVPMRDAYGKPIERFSMRPSYLQSLIYLLGYQTGYMYLRYLMWNYSGRQNDVASTGEIDHGNFITGISLIDDAMLGPQSKLPPELGKANKGRNAYFMIPFLLGLIGIGWMFYGSSTPVLSLRMRRTAWVSLIFFLMTGLAIVFYLNQSPGEPRERDYSFLGSFWLFAMWISFGMLFLLRSFSRRWLRSLVALFVVSVPLWMFAQNLDDHDRSRRSATLDYAGNLLESLDRDAILFVDGDNFIFPLWYAQEVMGVRRDVQVVCIAYLGCDWYVRQLMTPRYSEEALAMTATEGDIALGNFNIWRLPSASASDTLDAVEALRRLYSDPASTPAMPARYLRINGAREKSMDMAQPDSFIIDLNAIPGRGAGSIATLRELAMTDIVATNASRRYPRPIYWHQKLASNRYCGFYPFTRQALFTRKLAPASPDSVILVDESLDALPRLKWGGLDRAPYPGVDVQAQAAMLRSSLIRLAESLAAAGRHDQALHIARAALVRFPAEIVPFSIGSHADSVYFEAAGMVNVLREAGSALKDTAALSLADRIATSDSLRTASFREYRLSLDPGRRHAVSPDSRNHTISKIATD